MMNKKIEDMIFDERLISKEEMMVIEGLMLTNASEKKHKVFKRNKASKTLICKN